MNTSSNYRPPLSSLSSWASQAINSHLITNCKSQKDFLNEYYVSSQEQKFVKNILFSEISGLKGLSKEKIACFIQWCGTGHDRNQVLFSRVLCEALQACNETELDFTNIDIGPMGALVLAGAIKLGLPLTRLTLSGCGICNTGAIAIADAVSCNKQIKELRLSGNDLDRRSVLALEKMARNSSLEYLSLQENRFTPANTHLIRASWAQAKMHWPEPNFSHNFRLLPQFISLIQETGNKLKAQMPGHPIFNTKFLNETIFGFINTKSLPQDGEKIVKLALFFVYAQNELGYNEAIEEGFLWLHDAMVESNKANLLPSDNYSAAELRLIAQWLEMNPPIAKFDIITSPSAFHESAHLLGKALKSNNKLNYLRIVRKGGQLESDQAPAAFHFLDGLTGKNKNTALQELIVSYEPRGALPGGYNPQDYGIFAYDDSVPGWPYDTPNDAEKIIEALMENLKTNNLEADLCMADLEHPRELRDMIFDMQLSLGKTTVRDFIN